MLKNRKLRKKVQQIMFLSRRLFSFPKLKKPVSNPILNYWEQEIILQEKS